MVLAGFLLPDSLEKIRFFEETFMLANTSIKIVLNMAFFSLNNAYFQFNIK